MATTTTRASPDELRAAFKRAQRMPQMLEARDRVRTAIRQTSDAMDEDGGDSSAELNALFTQLKALLDEIDQRITRQATIDDLDRRASANPLGGSGDQSWDRQCSEFRPRRAIAFACNIPGVDAGRERETSAELARRSGRNFAGVPIPLRALSHNGPMRDAMGRRNVEQRVISSTTPAAGPGGALIPLVPTRRNTSTSDVPLWSARSRSARSLRPPREPRPAETFRCHDLRMVRREHRDPDERRDLRSRLASSASCGRNPHSVEEHASAIDAGHRGDHPRRSRTGPRARRRQRRPGRTDRISDRAARDHRYAGCYERDRRRADL